MKFVKKLQKLFRKKKFKEKKIRGENFHQM